MEENTHIELITIDNNKQIITQEELDKIIEDHKAYLEWRNLNDENKKPIRFGDFKNGLVDPMHYKRAYLQDKNLSNLDFRGADLSYSCFRGCCLSGANLSNCNFSHAYLRLSNYKLIH